MRAIVAVIFLSAACAAPNVAPSLPTATAAMSLETVALTASAAAAKAYRKLGAHSAAAAVLAHQHAHPWCGSRIDFGPILEHIKAARA